MATKVSSWRPTPKFLLRRDAVLRMSAGWEPGVFLEVGAGTGTMTRSFLDLGFEGVCSDISSENRSVLQKNLEEFKSKVSVEKDLEALERECFDYLFAFEVLEHIEDDLRELVAWSEKLKSGGRLLVSVPAHQSKFSREDEFVGHVRRYEKQDLIRLLEKAGYKNIEIFNYGFPLGNITGFLSRWLQVSGGDRNHLSPEQRSITSGVERSSVIQKIGPFYSDSLLWPAKKIQKFFFGSDLGDGYVATAVKGDD